MSATVRRKLKTTGSCKICIVTRRNENVLTITGLLDAVAVTTEADPSAWLQDTVCLPAPTFLPLLKKTKQKKPLSSALWLLSRVHGVSRRIWLLTNLVVLARGFLMQIWMEIAWEVDTASCYCNTSHPFTPATVCHTVGLALPSVTPPPISCLPSLPVLLTPLHGSLVMYRTAVEQGVSLVVAAGVTNSFLTAGTMRHRLVPLQTKINS